MSGKMGAGTSIRAEERFIEMTIEQIKDEVYYYIGKRITNDEAEEILWFIEDNPGVSLDEIVQEYFSC